MRFLTSLFALSTLCLLVGCSEPPADLSNPKSHTSGPFTFEYPQNWVITDEEFDAEFHYVFVETPGDAIVILQSYPLDQEEDLAGYAEQFSASAAAETPVGEMSESVFSELSTAHGYNWVVEEFAISFLGETIPHRRVYGATEFGNRQVFLILQVATEDYAMIEAGYQLIRDSLYSPGQADSELIEQDN